MSAQEQYCSAAGESWDNDAFWTSGQWIGEGQGAGPRHDTGRFQARQWIGSYQSANSRSIDSDAFWTSGEWIGKGQGAGPRHDTGRFQARQWIGTR